MTREPLLRIPLKSSVTTSPRLISSRAAGPLGGWRDGLPKASLPPRMVQPRAAFQRARSAAERSVIRHPSLWSWAYRRWRFRHKDDHHHSEPDRCYKPNKAPKSAAYRAQHLPRLNAGRLPWKSNCRTGADKQARRDPCRDPLRQVQLGEPCCDGSSGREHTKQKEDETLTTEHEDMMARATVSRRD